MKKLHMTFLNEDGSKKTLVIRCVHQDLGPEAVKEAMQQIVELDLFEKDGLRLMTEVYSAKYVEIIETPLFFDSNEMALPVPMPPVEENELKYHEIMDDNASDQSEEKQEVGKEEVSQGGSTPKKQLAKIYPFITREELNAQRAERAKKQKQAHSNVKRFHTNQQPDFVELVEPLFAPEPNKELLRPIERRDRGAPLLGVAA